MNNQITLIGHVGQAPISKLFGDTGNKVVKFSIAVKEYSANKEKAELWIDVDAWNGLGERILSTVTKGREIAVTGRLAISTYPSEKDGEKIQISKPVVKLTGFHLCGKKPDSVSEIPSAEKRAKRTLARRSQLLIQGGRDETLCLFLFGLTDCIFSGMGSNSCELGAEIDDCVIQHSQVHVERLFLYLLAGAIFIVSDYINPKPTIANLFCRH